MNIAVVGANYKGAPLEIREQIAAALGNQEMALAHLKDRIPNLDELVLLSTCNRFELYLASKTQQTLAVREAIFQLLCDICAAEPSDLQPLLYQYTDEPVVKHLFRVVTSLDSMVLGETQISYQVKKAWEAARQAKTIGSLLDRLFQQAVYLGRRARAETSINQRPISLASVAVDLVEDVLGNLDRLHFLLIGTGKIGALIASRLSQRKVGHISIASRRYRNALGVAQPLNAKAIHWAEISASLASVEVVISASAATHPIITVAQVKNILERRHSPLFFLDLAVPRDVEPEVKQLSGVRLFDVDALKTIAQAHRRQREKAIPQVETLIEQESERYWHWFCNRETASLIRALCQRAELLRQQEVKKTLHRLNLASPEQEALLEQMSQRIVNKLLHTPLVQMKRWKKQEQHKRDVVCELFDLELPTEGYDD